MRNARPTKVGEGAAYLAHEMNQPLAAILLNAEAALRWLMRDPPDFEAARQSIDRVVGNGRRAAQVAGRVRNMARKSAQARAGVNINEVVRTCLDLAGADLELHDISVETDLDDGLAPVEADRLQLEQLVTNLIANAVDAMQAVERRRHRLRIRTYRDTTRTVEVAIEDTGTGLDPTGIDHIFIPYHTTKRDGLGLGLSICRAIVEGHGGRLSAAPNVPHGSIFRFAIPANHPAVPLKACPAPD